MTLFQPLKHHLRRRKRHETSYDENHDTRSTTHYRSYALHESQQTFPPTTHQIPGTTNLKPSYTLVLLSFAPHAATGRDYNCGQNDTQIREKRRVSDARDTPTHTARELDWDGRDTMQQVSHASTNETAASKFHEREGYRYIKIHSRTRSLSRRILLSDEEESIDRALGVERVQTSRPTP